MQNIVNKNRPNGVKSHKFLGVMPNGNKRYQTDFVTSFAFLDKDSNERISSELRETVDGFMVRNNQLGIHVKKDTVEILDRDFSNVLVNEDIQLLHPRQNPQSNDIVLNSDTASSIDIAFTENENGFKVIKTMENSSARMVLTYIVTDGQGLKRNVEYTWLGNGTRMLRICVVWTNVLGDYLFPSGDFAAGRAQDVSLSKKNFENSGMDEFVFSKSTFVIGYENLHVLMKEDLTTLFNSGKLGNTVVGRQGGDGELYFKFWMMPSLSTNNQPKNLVFDATYAGETIKVDGHIWAEKVNYSGGTTDYWVNKSSPVMFGERHILKDPSRPIFYTRGYVQWNIAALYDYAIIVDVSIDLTSILDNSSVDIDIMITQRLDNLGSGSSTYLWYDAIAAGTVTYTGPIPLPGLNNYNLGSVGVGSLQDRIDAFQNYFALGFMKSNEVADHTFSFYAKETSTTQDAVLRVVYDIPASAGIEIGESIIGESVIG